MGVDHSYRMQSKLDRVLECGSASVIMQYITEESESDTRTSYPVTEIVWRGSTTACDDVVIAESPVFGRMLFLDGELQSAAADEHIYHEALVHPAMAGCPVNEDGARVLVVGGGEGATVREVLKWEPEVVDWVDIDGALVSVCENMLRWAPDVRMDLRVRLHVEDIRTFLTRSDAYDVIILDLPDPDGDTGYLYSDAFWFDVRSHLSPVGRLVTHCGPVRPFGNIGGGFRRLARQFRLEGFYSQVIPSFQSEWGFMLWDVGGDPFSFLNAETYLPWNLRVVDCSQLWAWSAPSYLWKSALIHHI